MKTQTDMGHKPFSNAVFSLIQPDQLQPAEQVPDKDPDTWGDEYTKAMDGSYDASYFTDEATGLFRFPNYNAGPKGLVKIKDVTRYREDYFAFMSREEQKAYTIDEFEYHFSGPVLEVQGFEEFLENLPPACFTRGISRKEVLELFDDYLEFIEGRDQPADYFDYQYKRPVALELGLLTLVDTTTRNPADLWEEVSRDDLEKVCTANNITPSRRRDVMTKRLLEKQVPFPWLVMQPATALRDCYHSFADLYIAEIRRITDHFHPLYFRSLWDEAERSSGNTLASEKATAIREAPYWADRLCRAVRL